MSCSEIKWWSNCDLTTGNWEQWVRRSLGCGVLSLMKRMEKIRPQKQWRRLTRSVDNVDIDLCEVWILFWYYMYSNIFGRHKFSQIVKMYSLRVPKTFQSVPQPILIVVLFLTLLYIIIYWSVMMKSTINTIETPVYAFISLVHISLRWFSSLSI